MTPTPPNPGAKSAFFVGYLKMPGRLALFLWLLLPLLVGVVGGAALALAVSNADPGDGGRLPGRVTLAGVIQLEPYPMLRLPADADNPAPRAVLLVRPGKNGAQQILEGMDGYSVEATGTFYERDGFHLFELAQVQEVDAPRAAVDPSVARPIGPQRLVGEIVDPKCYTGAMRPGNGKPHMMCGNRCLLGGVPPMAAIRAPDGSLTMVLLLAPPGQGRGAPGDDPDKAWYRDWVSLPVALTGEMSVLDDLMIMQVGADGIERL